MLLNKLNLKYLLCIGVCSALFSCNQQPKGLTEADVARMLDSVKTAAKEEAKNELKTELQAEVRSQRPEQYSEPCQQVTTSSSTVSSSTASSEMSEEEAAYKYGYNLGMVLHTSRFTFFTENDEKQLKNSYMNECRKHGSRLGPDNYSNRALYEEFKRGFIKGFEDGNNAL